MRNGTEMVGRMTAIAVLVRPASANIWKSGIIVDASASALSQVKAGRLVALGMTTARRWEGLPDVPAIAETLPGFEIVNWFGVVGPGGMDSALVGRLNKEMVRILGLPEVKDRLAAQSISANATTPAAFAAYMASEGGKWAKLIKDAGIRIN